MNTPEHPADHTLSGELRARLWAARTQESAARSEAARLARELSLTRRLLKFYLGTLPPAAPAAAAPSTGAATVLLSGPLVYHLDAREDLGTHTAVSGWAFRPASGWDARAATITLLLRDGDTVYATSCRKVQRADVAAFYARQSPDGSGGATGLEGVGFACEIDHDALPAGGEWKIVLRLECGGEACEQFTGEFLRI